MERIFYNIDIVNWIYGTVEKVKTQKIAWNKAWYDTYFELGGKSETSKKKACPKNAARVLYETGRLSNTNLDVKPCSLRHIWETDSRNGAYALMAVNLLCKEDQLPLSSLIKKVHKMAKKEFGTSPKSDQGAIKITHILWNTDPKYIKQIECEY